MAERYIGCDEDLLHMFFLCVRCLVTCSNGLGKRRWQHRWTALVVLFEYRVAISRVEAQGLTFIGCT